MNVFMRIRINLYLSETECSIWKDLPLLLASDEKVYENLVSKRLGYIVSRHQQDSLQQDTKELKERQEEREDGEPKEETPQEKIGLRQSSRIKEKKAGASIAPSSTASYTASTLSGVKGRYVIPWHVNYSAKTLTTVEISCKGKSFVEAVQLMNQWIANQNLLEYRYYCTLPKHGLYTLKYVAHNFNNGIVSHVTITNIPREKTNQVYCWLIQIAAYPLYNSHRLQEQCCKRSWHRQLWKPSARHFTSITVWQYYSWLTWLRLEKAYKRMDQQDFLSSNIQNVKDLLFSVNDDPEFYHSAFYKSASSPKTPPVPRTNMSSSLPEPTLEPVTLEPVTLEPVTLEPVTLEPVTLEPVTLPRDTDAKAKQQRCLKRITHFQRFGSGPVDFVFFCEYSDSEESGWCYWAHPSPHLSLENRKKSFIQYNVSPSTLHHACKFRCFEQGQSDDEKKQEVEDDSDGYNSDEELIAVLESQGQNAHAAGNAREAMKRFEEKMAAEQRKRLKKLDQLQKKWQALEEEYRNKATSSDEYKLALESELKKPLPDDVRKRLQARLDERLHDLAGCDSSSHSAEAASPPSKTASGPSKTCSPSYPRFVKCQVVTTVKDKKKNKQKKKKSSRRRRRGRSSDDLDDNADDDDDPAPAVLNVPLYRITQRKLTTSEQKCQEDIYKRKETAMKRMLASSSSSPHPAPSSSNCAPVYTVPEDSRELFEEMQTLSSQAPRMSTIMQSAIYAARKKYGLSVAVDEEDSKESIGCSQPNQKTRTRELILDEECKTPRDAYEKLLQNQMFLPWHPNFNLIKRDYCSGTRNSPVQSSSSSSSSPSEHSLPKPPPLDLQYTLEQIPRASGTRPVFNGLLKFH
jgi:hypothetical protein